MTRYIPTRITRLTGVEGLVAVPLTDTTRIWMTSPAPGRQEVTTAHHLPRRPLRQDIRRGTPRLYQITHPDTEGLGLQETTATCPISNRCPADTAAVMADL